MTTNELKALYIKAEAANKAIVTFPRTENMSKLQSIRDAAEREYEEAYWQAEEDQRQEMNEFHKTRA